MLAFGRHRTFLLFMLSFRNSFMDLIEFPMWNAFSSAVVSVGSSSSVEYLFRTGVAIGIVFVAGCHCLFRAVCNDWDCCYGLCCCHGFDFCQVFVSCELAILQCDTPCAEDVACHDMTHPSRLVGLASVAFHVAGIFSTFLCAA